MQVSDFIKQKEKEREIGEIYSKMELVARMSHEARIDEIRRVLKKYELMDKILLETYEQFHNYKTEEMNSK